MAGRSTNSQGGPAGSVPEHERQAAIERLRRALAGLSTRNGPAAPRGLGEDRRAWAEGLLEQSSRSLRGGGLDEASELDELGEGDPSVQAHPWPILDARALHGLAGEIVRELSPQTEADPVALLLTLLAMAGNCIGPGPHACVGMTRHPLRIWPVLVGATSRGRKGTSIDLIEHLFARADGAWTRQCLASGLSSGEGLIYAVRDPVTARERVRGTDPPEYTEVVVDGGVEDKRLLVIETEFAQALRVMRREGNTLSTTLRQAWDRGDLRVLVRNSPVRASGAHITIIAHAVAEEVRRYLTETEVAAGFANRFLWACVRRSRLLPDGGMMDRDVLERLAWRLARAIGAARQIGLMERSDAARARWAEVYPQLSAPVAGLCGAVLGRAEAQVLRLSALYAALDGSRVIELAHLDSALALWRYCEESVRWLFGDSLGDAVADRLLRELRDHGELTLTEIRQIVFANNLPARRIAQAVRRLQELGLAEVVQDTPGGPGRPATVVRAVS